MDVIKLFMKEDLQDNKNIFRKVPETEKRSAELRQYYILLAGKIFDVAEDREGKIHVYL